MSAAPTPSDDPEPLNQFFSRARKNPAYVINLLYTLEVNKLEAVHQHRDKPRIFIKTTDDLGIVLNCRPNPASDAKVSLPSGEFTATEIEQILTRLEQDEQFLQQLRLALVCGNLEYAIYSSPTDPAAIPFLTKEFDESGLPTAYAMNWPTKEGPKGEFKFGPPKPKTAKSGRKKASRLKR